MTPLAKPCSVALPLLALLAFLPLSCDSSPVVEELPHELLDLSDGPVGSFFSLTRAGEALHLIIPDYQSLSLRMNILKKGSSGEPPAVSETLFLDRISHTQETDFLFGNHLYLHTAGEQDVFYFDQEKEDRRILKWIHRPASATRWTVDTLPLGGRLIGGWRDDRGRPVLFLEHQDVLYSSADSRLSRFEPALEPFAAEGDITVLDGTSAGGFTVFDRRSGQILLIHMAETGLLARPLLRGGKIHHAVRGADGGLRILVFEPRKSELLLYREDERGRLRSTAVTPCRGTTSVFLFEKDGSEWFLFNEQIVVEEGRRIQQVSLLYPTRDGYRKTVVFSSEEPIQSFRAVEDGRRLYLVLSQERLRMVAADLQRLSFN